MADSLFDQTKDQPQFDENKDYLAELTGPGGKFDRTKYKSDEEMYKAIAKGKAFADRTIEHRNKEFDELREQFLSKTAEANAAAKFEDMFNQYMGNRQQNNSDKQPNDEDEKPTLDAQQIAELLDKRLQEKDARDQEKRNMDELEKRLTQRFGDRARAELQGRMSISGLTADDIKLLARKSPEVALNALGVFPQQGDNYQAPPASSMRSDNFQPNANGKRTASYWDKLKKSDPKKYWSPESSTQRMKDIDELGAAFDDISRRPNFS